MSGSHEEHARAVLIRVGYWSSEPGDGFPEPVHIIDAGESPDDVLVDFLGRG